MPLAIDYHIAPFVFHKEFYSYIAVQVTLVTRRLLIVVYYTGP